jgi:hypothetical protein
MKKVFKRLLSPKHKVAQDPETSPPEVTSPGEVSPIQFALFTTLPAEIKLQIWNLAYDLSVASNEQFISDQRTISKGRIIEVIPRYNTITSHQEEVLQFTIYTSLPPDRLLAVNREARTEFLKRYLTPFSPDLKIDNEWFNPEKGRWKAKDVLVDPTNDILFLHHIPPQPSALYPKNISAYFSTLFPPTSSPSLLSKLTHLIIPRQFFTSRFFGGKVKGIPSRELIWNVFPNLKRLGLCYGTHGYSRFQSWEIHPSYWMDGCGPVRVKTCWLDRVQAGKEPWGLKREDGCWVMGVMRWRMEGCDEEGVDGKIGRWKDGRFVYNG